MSLAAIARVPSSDDGRSTHAGEAEPPPLLRFDFAAPARTRSANTSLTKGPVTSAERSVLKQAILRWLDETL